MPLQLAFRRAAGQDLAAAYGWYEAQRPGLGEQFLSAVNASFDLIGQFPEMFALVHGDVRRAIVSRFPYAVFYRVEPRRIVVLAILHTARDPRTWPRSRQGR